MNASKFLASTVATAAVISAIGFSYAQGISPTNPGAAAKSINETPGPMGRKDGSSAAMPSGSTTSTTANDTSSTTSEPAARGDRG